MIERVWEWRFAAPPESLWPVLADTARFNEAVGLPRYAVIEAPLPDGTVRRTGSAQKFGIALRWEEGVPEWVAPRSFLHERRFPSGPLRLVRTEITVDPDGGTGSLVRYRLSLTARFGLEPLLRLVFFRGSGARSTACSRKPPHQRSAVASRGSGHHRPICRQPCASG